MLERWSSGNLRRRFGADGRARRGSWGGRRSLEWIVEETGGERGGRPGRSLRFREDRLFGPPFLFEWVYDRHKRTHEISSKWREENIPTAERPSPEIAVKDFDRPENHESIADNAEKRKFVRKGTGIFGKKRKRVSNALTRRRIWGFQGGSFKKHWSKIR